MADHSSPSPSAVTDLVAIGSPPLIEGAGGPGKREHPDQPEKSRNGKTGKAGKAVLFEFQPTPTILKIDHQAGTRRGHRRAATEAHRRSSGP